MYHGSGKSSRISELIQSPEELFNNQREKKIKRLAYQSFLVLIQRGLFYAINLNFHYESPKLPFKENTSIKPMLKNPWKKLVKKTKWKVSELKEREKHTVMDIISKVFKKGQNPRLNYRL